MKIVAVKRVLGKGALAPSTEWQQIRQGAEEAVEAIDWPIGSGRFTIYPVKDGNGVRPIKKRAAELIRQQPGWQLETPWPIRDSVKPGDLDGAYQSSTGLVGFEWETGNISSSHRSINKICLGFYQGVIVGAILAISSNKLAPFLTDRIGNIGELERYFPLWAATPCTQGVLDILVVEHDRESMSVQPIPKGKRRLEGV